MPEMSVKGRSLRGTVVEEILEPHRVGEMRILSDKGDTRVTWNARDTDEVEAARAQFQTLVDRGFRAFAVEAGSGGKGEMITEFNPDTQKVILAPPMAGGR